MIRLLKTETVTSNKNTPQCPDYDADCLTMGESNVLNCFTGMFLDENNNNICIGLADGLCPMLRR